MSYTNLDSLHSRLFYLEDEVAENKKVTRITAKDEAPVTKAEAKAKTPKVKVAKAEKPVKEGRRNVFVRIGAYFKGAWVELRLVRWPTRKATWGLTVAVILFSAFFVVMILLLDALFKYVFELIIT